MINPAHVLSLIVSLLTFSGAVYAQQAEDEEPLKFYDVEIVIFKNVKVPRGQEYNLPTPLTRKPAASIDLFDPESVETAAELGFTPLLSEELRLHEAVKRVTRSSRYELLLHAGWRQPGLEQDKSLPVWIRGGELFDSNYQSIDQMMFRPAADKEEENPAEDSTPLAQNQAVEPDVTNASSETVDLLYELEGQITIVLSRYLHTQADLVLRKPGTSGSVSMASGAPPSEPLHGNLLLNYALTEKRRMRSNRLHYLDHPQFGMLVLITPYEAPPPEELETEQTPPDGGNAEPVPESNNPV